MSIAPKFGNLTEQAYFTIRDGILCGKLPFGTPLSRRKLAAELGISIVPVGDALQRLENEGLVESRPRIGTRVLVPTAKSIRGHYVVREALETQSARLFSEKSSSAERDQLIRLAKDLDARYELCRDGSPSEDQRYDVHKHHVRLHMFIAQCTGCDELCEAIERNKVLEFNWLYDVATEPKFPPAGWHTKLAGSLVIGDVAAADAGMREHVRYRLDEVLEQLSPYFERPDETIRRFSARG